MNDKDNSRAHCAKVERSLEAIPLSMTKGHAKVLFLPAEGVASRGRFLFGGHHAGEG